MDARLELGNEDEDGFIHVERKFSARATSTLLPGSSIFTKSTTEENKETITPSSHYQKQIKKHTDLLQHLKDNLKINYIDKNLPLTRFSFINSVASKAGLGKTNQPYAKKAIDIINVALVNRNAEPKDQDFYILTCFEKLLILYHDNTKGDVSGFIKNAFSSSFNMTEPVDVEKFQEIKLTLFKEMRIEAEIPKIFQPELKDSGIFNMTCTSEEYDKALKTWTDTVLKSTVLRP